MSNTQLENIDKRYIESNLKQLTNNILVGLLIAISYLPFWILYRISDLSYLILRFVLKYRFKVITDNLKHAFPEKSNKEIGVIRDKFYRHLGDMLVESIKLYSISDKEMAKRLEIKGTETAEELYKQKRSLIAMAFHHSNWEWTSFAQSKIPHQILTVYNPLRGNSALEKFLVHNREKWGSKCVPVNKTVRAALEYKSKGIPTGLWLAADQTPPANSKFWAVFLNREAPFFTGPEKIAVSGNLPVFFQHTKKIGRGRYIIEYSMLIENPKEVKQKDILLAYIRKCEEIIRAEPAYYLWSHRRWKHKRPEGIELSE